jgi:hypothetical protein
LREPPKGELGLSAFPVHRYDEVALAALLMIAPIEATSSLSQPFSKCRAFHCRALVDDTTRPGFEARASKNIMWRFVSAALDLGQEHAVTRCGASHGREIQR